MQTDRFDRFVNALARRDTTAIARIGSEVLVAIDHDMKELQEESRLVRSLMSRYGAIAPEASSPHQVGISVPRSTVPPLSDGFSSAERGRIVREAAIRLAKSGRAELRSRDVIDALSDITFSVKRPTSMVGTVLSRMKEFERIAQDRFRYRGVVGAA
ncbi:MAG: hypothetical protein HYX90_12185 [Chloroflexi bacterium]|nr:hypothetical protein [Chloroflexota bacterium]